jgi:hypothetical protein
MASSWPLPSDPGPDPLLLVQAITMVRALTDIQSSLQQS